MGSSVSSVAASASLARTRMDSRCPSFLPLKFLSRRPLYFSTWRSRALATTSTAAFTVAARSSARSRVPLTLVVTWTTTCSWEERVGSRRISTLVSPIPRSRRPRGANLFCI